MKQLTCEMCGSTDLLKQDGVFVCQTCGTKYSVEEAKKMMIEGTVNVSGTVKVDNTDKIKNYLEMAKSAYEAGNKGEAEAYCNRIIEIEPQNYEAWFMKGKAAGWQSTLANIRIEESVQCFSKAIDYAPEDKIEEIKNSAAEEISNLSTVLVSLPCDNFKKYQSQDNAKTIVDCALKAKKYALSLLVKCGIKPDEYEKAVATLINNASMNAWNNVIQPEYSKDNNGRPSHYAFSTLIEKAGFCSTLIKAAIDFADNDELNDATRYENLVAINEYCINACSWTQKYGTEPFHFGASFSERKNAFEDHWYWEKEYTLTDSAIASRRDDNAKYRDKSKSCKERGQRRQKEENERKAQEQKERNEKYWSEHADEKQTLESERDTLQSQLKQLQEQVAPYDKEINTYKHKREADTPAQEEKKKLEEQISNLRTEKNNLGIFKGKEKKALQAQIDKLISRLSTIDESIEAEQKEQIKMCNDKIKEIEQKAKPIKEKIVAAQKCINEINLELTKNR